MIYVIQTSQFCTRLPKSKEMEVKHYFYINFALTPYKRSTMSMLISKTLAIPIMMTTGKQIGYFKFFIMQ